MSDPRKLKELSIEDPKIRALNSAVISFARWEAAMPDQQRDWMVDNSKAFKWLSLGELVTERVPHLLLHGPP